MSLSTAGSIDRLVLGTAQLGMPYGIANRSGQPDQGLANDILDTAWHSGIRILDTAQGYGDSEAVIGRFLKSHPHCRFDVITKLAPDVDITSTAHVTAAVNASAENLGQKPKAMFLHRYQQLKNWDGNLKKCLCELQQQGTIGDLGISLYDPEEFAATLSVPEIQCVQAPFNVFDRRLKKDSLIEAALKLGKQIFLRSAFLQGLLLIDPGRLPPTMSFAVSAVGQWRDFCTLHKIPPAQTALQYVRWANPKAQIVIGCETVEQLLLNIGNWVAELPPGDIFKNMPLDHETEPRLIDPSRWPALSTT